MRVIFIIIFILFFFTQTIIKTYAIVDPLAVPNNKYGIHVVDENDFPDAAKLVNSTGGDWGYVTLVIADNDRNIEKWQKKLDLLRQLHLIPILRLATHPKGDLWEKPEISDAKDWVDFLSHLYWVSKNRYIVIFNEPNHAREWNGTINPKEYAEILNAFSQNLKKASPDFFILPAGFDASAPNSNDTMDEVAFLKEMLEADPFVFSVLDGWTSHSYPNPGFRGNAADEGRGTLKTYQWELDLLQSLGQKKNLPVFITETGWAHTEGITINRNYYTADQIALFLKEAAETAWTDPSVVAITPFILNYQSYPFANFSWKKLNKESFYPFYDTYKSLPKIAGKPVPNSVFDNFDGLALKNLLPNYVSGSTRLMPIFNKNFWQGLFSQLFKL